MVMDFRFDHAGPNDEIAISVNGSRLEVSRRHFPLVLKAHGTHLVDAAGQECYHVRIPKGIVRQGWNEVQVVLRERRPLSCPLRLEEVSLSITYAPATSP